MPAATELLLVNLGTPAAPTAEGVRAFLAEFLGDPRVVDWPRWVWRPVLSGIVLRTRPARSAEAYRAIWTEAGSPLAVATEGLAAAVAERVPAGTRVTACYRYGAARVDRAIEAAAGRAERVVVVPLFPQRTASSSGTVEAFARATAERLGLGERLVLARLAPDDPGYVEALADRTRAALADGAEHLVGSFHGIPARVDRAEGETYSSDCRRTHEALVAALGWPPERAALAYQSRFGPERWLEPATAELLAALPARGVRGVAVACPGFLTPGLETLEEIGLRGRDALLAAGGEALALAGAPSDHPALADALARLAGPG